MLEMTADRLMTPQEVADFIGVSVETLNVWRCTRRYRLAYIKVGRLVRYRLSDIKQFLETRTQDA
jgi:excisionase family DNA binding protein